jgi:hypothetical protein
MAENKFIKRLHGKETAKSVVEIKNTATPTMFTNMPAGDSNVFNTYSDHRGNATGVLRGTDNWKLSGSSLVPATTVYGDGRDMTGAFVVGNAGLWIDATYTFTEPKLFTPNTEWVLKLCGNGLLSDSNDTVELTMLIKFGSTMVSKTFFLPEQSFSFSEELVIDFSESIAQTIKVNAGDTMVVQVLCGDSSAHAQIYNGMTVFTALQRRVDGDAVASDKKTFDEVVQDIDDINDEIVQIHEDIDDLEEYVDDTFVKKAGDTMSGALNIENIASSNAPLLTLTHSNTATYKWNIAPRYNSTTLSVYPGSTETNGYRFASTGFVPSSNDARYLGSASLKWKGVYTAMLNNGGDLVVPAVSGTIATKADVDLAANSGRMLTDQGVWYAKMYAATVAPSAENGTNYADFSQVDGQGNPIIVIYERQNGAWVQSETITPPAEYDGYVPITSKIWDIAEQAGQQGGRILWNHQSKEFTPYPQIISFDGQNITNSTFSGGTITNSTFSGTATLSGESTVAMSQTPTGDQIVNKYYVDHAISNAIGNGTITITQGGTTKGTFTTNQGGNTTIDIDAGGGGSGLNVGDTFLTMRNDNELNGAVECDGATYNTTDFIGSGSIGELLEAGKLDYISLSAYSTAISTKGWCDKIGWDGTGTTAFRVPTLNAHIVQTNNIPVVGNGMTLGLTNGTNNAGTVWASGAALDTKKTQYGQPVSTTAQSSSGGITGVIGITTDSSKSGIIADTSNTAQLRVMIQLANGATDEALETCTSVLADVANLKDHRVIAFQAPTAANNYTWYRKYADGWVEQGGYYTGVVNTGSSVSITLPITMVDANYIVLITGEQNSNAWSSASLKDSSRTTTGFDIFAVGGSSGDKIKGASWQVSGMSAS